MIRKFFLIIALILISLVIIEIFLFCSYLSEIKNFKYKIPANADSIVCLTGGFGRIDEGLRLLSEGKGKVLLISGTYETSKLSEILEALNFKGEIDASKIFLDNSSKNTMENANEASKFVIKNNYDSVILVTSVYHIKRAYYIFRKIIPSRIQIYAHPILTKNLTYKKMFFDKKIRNYILLEFIKYSWYRLILI